MFYFKLPLIPIPRGRQKLSMWAYKQNERSSSIILVSHLPLYFFKFICLFEKLKIVCVSNNKPTCITLLLLPLNSFKNNFKMVSQYLNFNRQLHYLFFLNSWIYYYFFSFKIYEHDRIIRQIYTLAPLSLSFFLSACLSLSLCAITLALQFTCRWHNRLLKMTA